MIDEPIDAVVSRRQSVKEKIDELKSMIKVYDSYIGSHMDAAGYRLLSVGDYLVSRRAGSAPRKHIDPNKLLELGVPAHIIAEATVAGEPGKPGITVRRIGEKEEPDPFTEWAREVREKNGAG